MTTIAEGARACCHGAGAALPGRLESWQEQVVGDSAKLAEALATHGSPVNLINPAPLTRNAAELVEAGARLGVPVRVFFARKANKALALVDAALAAGHCVDVSSLAELEQVMAAGAAPDQVIVTAAVKPRELLRAVCRHRVTVSLDGLHEASALADVLREEPGWEAPPVALRLNAELEPPSRFGLTAAAWLEWLDGRGGAVGAAGSVGAAGAAGAAGSAGAAGAAGAAGSIGAAGFVGATGAAGPSQREGGTRWEVRGVHFHLHGYAAADRVRALRRAIDFGYALVDRGHPISFIDIGGGVPMSYLTDEEPWREFWAAHVDGLRTGAPLTWNGRPLGLQVTPTEVHGRPAVYPMFQTPVRGEWLAEVLGAAYAGNTLADALRERGWALHVEPGRSLLDGCGLTVARVEAVKTLPDGRVTVTCAMNRTQCRSAADDFLIDPLLVPGPRAGRGEVVAVGVGAVGAGVAGEPAAGQAIAGQPIGVQPIEGQPIAGQPIGGQPIEGQAIEGQAIEGYLVGAYCIEDELLTWRRLRFPHGVSPGDMIVFVNTAGYQMHILESASHQIPLAANLIVSELAEQWVRDRIDTTP